MEYSIIYGIRVRSDLADDISRLHHYFRNGLIDGGTYYSVIRDMNYSESEFPASSIRRRIKRIFTRAEWEMACQEEDWERAREIYHNNRELFGCSYIMEHPGSENLPGAGEYVFVDEKNRGE